MKYIEKKTYLLFLTILFGVGISSCSIVDEVTVIVPKTVAEYQQQMKQFVTSELVVVNNCVVGYNKGDFKSTTNFDTYKADYLAALKDDSTIIEKPNVTIDELIAANKTLAVPGKLFTSSLWISDRRALNDLIVEAETLNTATIAGTAVGQVTDAAKTIFITAIATAKTVRGASTTIDRQVTEAITALGEAKKVFVAYIIK